MKTLLKITGILLVLIIALLFILPMIYKSEIIRLTKIEMNKNVNATIDFDDISLSLIRSFPDFNLSIEKLYITGKGKFDGDTLVKINEISISIDLTSVLSSESYEIKKIKLYEPQIAIQVFSDGESNYDITLPSTESDINTEVETEASDPFNLSIKKFEIINGSIIYTDEQLNMHLALIGINHLLSGDLGSDNVVLHTNTRINSLSTTYEGIEYLSNISVSYNAKLDADMKNEIYTLGKNELVINNLFIGFDGLVSFVNDDLNIVLTFNSKGNKFKDILSMVPAIYAKDFDGIETNGTFSLDGYVKGIYNENKIPSFELNTTIEDGSFKYPELPKSVKNINLISSVSNKGGEIDNTVIDVSKFSMLLGNNPINANFKISTPVSDPDIKARITGKFNLAETKDYYPLPSSEDLKGELIMDINMEGRMSSIENEKFDEFLAMGSLVVKNINYQTSSLREPVNIESAQLNFSPAYIDLVSFKAKNGDNDFQATGKIENYMSYYLNNGILKGTLIANSKYLNIDNLFVDNINSDNSNETATPVGTAEPDTSTLTTVEIPENIDFSVSATFDELIYDKLNMKNVKGDMEVNNSILYLNNLSMETVGGKMTINGMYSSKDIDHPEVDLKFNMSNMSIPNAYDQFAIFRKYIPLTKKTTGLFSASFNVASILEKNMMPDYATLNGGGMLSTKSIAITGLNSLTQIAEKLNIEKLNHLAIDDFMTKFKLENGKLIVKPTKFNYNDIDVEIAGWTSLDQSIEYEMKVNVPRNYFGSDANNVLDNLVAQANSLGTNFSMPAVIPINISIGGTLDKPVIKSSLSKSVSGSNRKVIKEIVKEQLGKEIAVQANKIIEDADKQAKYLIQEAKKQANLIKKNAGEAVKLLQSETDKQANALIKEGKKNGFVAEMAAKEAAKQLRKEAASNETKLLSEANKNADKLIKEAEKGADRLKKGAQKEADKLKK
jgi:AsmA-like protein